MKRCLRKVCVFLILGATFNIAVAWGCALRSGRHAHANRDLRPSTADVQWFEHGASTALQDHKISGLWVDEKTSARAFGIVGQYYSASGVINRVGPEDARVFYSSIDAGWPFLSLSGALWQSVATNGADRLIRHEFSVSAIELGFNPGDDMWGFLFDARLIPLRPLWPGFAINTIFYAAILWLPLAVLGAFRRRRRIKRGLCPKCAYDLRGSQDKFCPECGAKGSE